MFIRLFTALAAVAIPLYLVWILMLQPLMASANVLGTVLAQ